MGEVTRYPQGTFCWIDLGTTDIPGAKAFYGAMFGWDMEDLGGYILCRLGGQVVTGFHEHSPEEGTGWSSNICVEDQGRHGSGPGTRRRGPAGARRDPGHGQGLLDP